MEKKIVRTLVKYSVSFAVGGGMAAAVLFSQGYFRQTEPLQKYKILCDAFTLPGALFMLIAGLLFASGGGVFDGIGFSVGRFFNIFASASRRSRESYAEYKERKRGGGKLKGYSFLFFTGLAFFAAAVVFLLLFYRASP